MRVKLVQRLLAARHHRCDLLLQSRIPMIDRDRCRTRLARNEVMQLRRISAGGRRRFVADD
jgi:hypothetical protein